MNIIYYSHETYNSKEKSISKYVKRLKIRVSIRQRVCHGNMGIETRFIYTRPAVPSVNIDFRMMDGEWNARSINIVCFKSLD